ncbi:MAG: hypothetical protein FJ125_05170 [Deltaproteobacteria bacterium]|nr:hypothetical protein [Deltaproteobacteria bacterium]
MIDRYLANENFPAATVRWLRSEGNDVIHAAEEMNGAADEEILRRAQTEDRLVLTFDRDFGELVFRRQEPAASGAVLFRLGLQPPEVVLPFLEGFFRNEPELRGFFTVASPGRYRQVRLR